MYQDAVLMLVHQLVAQLWARSLRAWIRFWCSRNTAAIT